MRLNTAWKPFLLLLCFDIATSAASSQSVRLYVDNSEGDDVSVIDLKTLNTVDDIRLADKIHGLAIQRDGRRLFATIESDNTLRVIETATNNVIATINLTGAVTGTGTVKVISTNVGTLPVTNARAFILGLNLSAQF